LTRALYCRSKIHSRDGNFQEAINDLSLAAQANDIDAPRFLIELAKVYLKINDPEKALSSIKRLREYSEIKVISKDAVAVELGLILTDAAFGLRTAVEGWKNEMRQILPSFVKQEFTAGISTALVFQLEKLKQSGLNATALDSWVADWENVSRDYPELQIGIRMLRAGVEWIKTTDEGALLDLVKEERVIVRQALGLEPEAEE
jgi:hypothetical protein